MKKSLASLTVAASLLGGAAGALAFAPNLVSAQTAVDADGATETDTEPPRGAWLADVLDGLVDEGTLTATQADAVAEAIAEALPERPEGHWGRGHARLEGIDELSDLLDLEPREIADALRSGDTLADVAAAQGVDRQEIIDAMVARATERIDEAVADGRIDADAAAERLAGITEHITDLVDGEAAFGGPGGHGPRPFGDRSDRPFGPGHFGERFETDEDGAGT